MCVYNRANASYGCQNSKLLNGILKDELAFQGYVVSDWGATHSGVASIEAGLDMDMVSALCRYAMGCMLMFVFSPAASISLTTVHRSLAAMFLPVSVASYLAVTQAAERLSLFLVD